MSYSGASKGTRYSKKMRINSDNRINKDSTTSSNFTVNFGDNLQKARLVSLISCSFYNVMYNMFNEPQKFNNIFFLRWTPNAPGPVVEERITIRPGYYSVTQLHTAIAAAVLASAFGTTWTFTYDSIRNHSTVVSNAGAYGAGVFRMYSPTPGEIDTRIVTESPITKLGYRSGDIVPISPADPFEAEDSPNMSRTDVAYIKSAALAPSNSFDEEGKVSNLLVGIPINVPFRSLQLFETKQDILIQNDFGMPRPINSIDIQLVDHDEHPLDLDGTPLNLDLQVWYDQY